MKYSSNIETVKKSKRIEYIEDYLCTHEIPLGNNEITLQRLMELNEEIKNLNWLDNKAKIALINLYKIKDIEKVVAYGWFGKVKITNESKAMKMLAEDRQTLPYVFWNIIQLAYTKAPDEDTFVNDKYLKSIFEIMKAEFNTQSDYNTALKVITDLVA